MKTISQNAEKRLCGLYVRVSTLRQASVEDGSLDAQINHLQRYIDYENRSGKSEWSVVEVYREEGKSGKDLKRPEFERMVRDINAERINTIVIWKIDRLTRSLSDFCSVWDMLEQRGIQLISLNEKFDTGTAIGRAMLKIILIFAELEREQTSERTAMALDYRANLGLWNGGRVIGYDPDPESKSGLKVNPDFAQVVRLAYDLCIEHGSAGATTRLLNEKGFRMPAYESRRGKKQGGGLFSKQSVIRMLTNPVYVGEFMWHGDKFKGLHEPLVTRKKYDHVQRILNVNRKNRNTQRKAKRHVFLLQGVLRCGKCGAMMTPAWGTNGSGQPYHYYWCSKRQHVGKEACDSKYVPAEPLEKMVVDRLKELSTDENEIVKIVDQANSRQSEMLRKLATDLDQLNRQHRAGQDKLDSLVKVIEDEGAEAFRTISARMKQLEAEKLDLERQIEAVRFEISRVKEETLSATTMAQTFRSFAQVVESASPEGLKLVIPQIVEVIEWHEDPADPGSGHYRIAYFEQPKLGIRRNATDGACGDICSAPSTDWLRW